jgi:hypothetical protein
MSGNCKNCKYLVRSVMPSVGTCTCPASAAPDWQGGRRLVNIKAVKDCPAWSTDSVLNAELLLRIDLKELRRQKCWIIRQGSWVGDQFQRTREAEGLLFLIDAIQDQIHESGLAGVLSVYGNL